MIETLRSVVMNFEMSQTIWSLIMAVCVSVAVLTVAPIMLIVERRGSAWLQRRSGPNRVGPWGLLQPISDALKLVFKEENIPAKAHKTLFILAPAIGIIPPVLAFAVIPVGGSLLWKGIEYPMQVSMIDTGLLFLLAITSLHVYSVLTAGWSSNNKFAMMGALRSSSQMISYEIAIGITIVSMVITYGTLDLREIVKLQEYGNSNGVPLWGAALQPIAFLLLWVSSFAETNRLPFDLPEGESELVAGYHTEYSGLKWALFFLGEYAAMAVASGFLTTLFLGGYNIPFTSESGLREWIVNQTGWGLEAAALVTALLLVASFTIKVAFFMWMFVWVRWTLPRFRYDQLMDLGWRIMLPIGVVNAIGTLLVSYYLNNR